MERIWIINHYGEPPTTGKYTRHYNFAKNLISRGYDVKIFTASTIHRTDINYIKDNSKFKEEEIEGVPFVFVRACNYKGNGKQRIKNMLEYSIRVLGVTKEFEKPDVIFSSSPHPLTWLASYFIAKRYNAKFIAETRDRWPETFVAMGALKRNSIVAKILYSLEKFIYKKSDKLVFTIKGGKEYIKDRKLEKDVCLDKIYYINNGIDIEEFNINKKRLPYIDKDLEEENTFKIIYTGAMGQANSLNYLVKAAELIQNKGIKDIKFILFGDGYERIELEEYVKTKKLNNVVFKGKVEKKYIPNILSNSDLNIITAKDIKLYKYGLSLNKMFDYFASGKPTISNMSTGYDLLEEYKCGLTVESGSSKSLAKGILKFYNMPKEEYETYCKNALIAAKDFDFKSLTDKLEKIILED